jgi:hypothetical protein
MALKDSRLKKAYTEEQPTIKAYEVDESGSYWVQTTTKLAWS